MDIQRVPRCRMFQSPLTIIDVEFLHDLMTRHSTDAQHIIELERLLQQAGMSNQRLQIANNTLSKQCEGLQKAQIENLDIREGLMKELIELEEVINADKETIRLLREEINGYKLASKE
ncbi:hypothetical protein MauCBS54593_005319 [Microsporum audouinii]